MRGVYPDKDLIASLVFLSCFYSFIFPFSSLDIR